MSKELVLYGFDGSTYVRTVRMLLANKEFEYELVPVNVLTGETRQPEHLERNPFGRVPVIDYRGLRLYETSAIARYLDEVIPGQTHIPTNPIDRARMNMAMGVVDSDGYGAILMVAAYHLFPDFIGGKNEEVRGQNIEKSKLVISEIMKLRSSSRFIAGDNISLADLYLAPLCFYVGMTEDAAPIFDVEGFGDWWKQVQLLDSFTSTTPNLG